MMTAPPSYAWAILFASDNVIDGKRAHLGGGAGRSRHEAFMGYRTMAFATRAAARRHINENYACFSRPDLRAEPHGWKMPKAVRVKIMIEQT